MKIKKYIAILLVFFSFILCACNSSDTFNETQDDDILKQTDAPLSDSQNNNTSETTVSAQTDDPFCGPVNKEYDGIFVRTSIEDYVTQIEKHQSGKLVNYPIDIAAIFAKYGFTEVREIAYTRIKDLEGNYSRFEELFVIYHMPECKNDRHNDECMLNFAANIRESQHPFKVGSYNCINTINGLEIYEYDGPYDINKQFKVKIGEFVECSIRIPYDIVGEEKAAEIFDQIIAIAQDIREKLLEAAPELITTP
jgi:hypothetical protein